MKYKPMALISARDKMPFEVTPLVPYLTWYVEASLSQVESNPTIAFNQVN